MSAKGTGVVNVERRTWDKEEYAKRAEERKLREANGEEGEGDKKLELGSFQVAPAGAEGPAGSRRAYLERRTYSVDVDSKLGVKETVNLNDALQKGGGYYCPVCECLLKDSSTYLSHINGIKHQRLLGFSMRVKQSSVDDVKSKLDELKKQKERKDEPVDFKARYEAKMREREEQEEQERDSKRLEKVRRREEAKKAEEKGKGDAGAAGEGEGEVEVEEMSPEMMEMLGLKGFS